MIFGEPLKEMTSAYGQDLGINPKLPTWSGDWKNFPDYRFAALLELDGCKEDERVHLAPKLVRNLSGRAWEACLEINRERLRTKDGVEYLLEYLKGKRGKQEVDLLGDALEHYFQTGEAVRRDGESLNDFEQRHAVLVRDIAKAMVELGIKDTVPTEIYGWFVINRLLRLDYSDVAVIKAQSSSYKLEDVMNSLRKMWGGDSLTAKDSERKRSYASKTYMATNDEDEEYDEESSILMNQHEEEELNQEEEQTGESYTLYEEAMNAMIENPEDEQCWANFQEAKKLFYKDARKALDRSRVTRGFYPTNGQKGKGKGKESGYGKGSSGNTGKGKFNGNCIRCGKYGHKAMDCRQVLRTSTRSDSGASKTGVGFVFGASVMANGGKRRILRCLHCGSREHQTTECGNKPCMSMWQRSEDLEDQLRPTYATLQQESISHAILDCGASESIVGAHTLQKMCDNMEAQGVEVKQVVTIDRNVSRNFLFGNNQTSSSLGLAEILACVNGVNVKLQAHVVEGPTPLLLSSQWLLQHDAKIDFSTGMAAFDFTGGEEIKLKRSPTHHLLLPLEQINAELANEMIYKNPAAQQLSPDEPDVIAHDAGES